MNGDGPGSLLPRPKSFEEIILEAVLGPGKVPQAPAQQPYRPTLGDAWSDVKSIGEFAVRMSDVPGTLIDAFEGGRSLGRREYGDAGLSLGGALIPFLPGKVLKAGWEGVKAGGKAAARMGGDVFEGLTKSFTDPMGIKATLPETSREVVNTIKEERRLLKEIQYDPEIARRRLGTNDEDWIDKFIVNTHDSRAVEESPYVGILLDHIKMLDVEDPAVVWDAGRSLEDLRETTNLAFDNWNKAKWNAIETSGSISKQALADEFFAYQHYQLAKTKEHFRDLMNQIELDVEMKAKGLHSDPYRMDGLAIDALEDLNIIQDLNRSKTSWSAFNVEYPWLGKRGQENKAVWDQVREDLMLKGLVRGK